MNRAFPIQQIENYHRILHIQHIQFNIDSKSQLLIFLIFGTILIFGTNFNKNYTSDQNHKKMKITIEFFIFELV